MYNPNQSHPAPTWCRVPKPIPRDGPRLSPRGEQRAERIREIFLKAFRGLGGIDDVRVAAIQAGLLDDVRAPNSQRNVVRAALAPIAEPFSPGRA